MSPRIERKPLEHPLPVAERLERTRSAAFGSALTEHLVSVEWDAEQGWHSAQLQPYEPLLMDPAMVGLHYGQVVFEGVKAFRTPDGAIRIFRPEAHARRFQDSARRLMMPEMPQDLFVAALDELTRQDQDWLPDDPEMSLYLRPLLYGSERTLALRPARQYRFLLMAFVTEAYFGRDQKPVRVWVTEEFSRAAAGGTGAAKCAGNYAGSLLAQEQAKAKGCDQVVWLDSAEHRWVEEMGGMNLFFVHGSGADTRLTTPPLTGTLLPGVTRASLLDLAADLGIPAAEEPLSLDAWRAGCVSGEITEVFACGTAARVSPVNEVATADGSWVIGDGRTGPLTARLAELLTSVQQGTAPDAHGWMHDVPLA
ncbi:MULTISPECIES: branched-chain amino acid aminotransferase [unclassified Kitasatospora]|uniref:branched-chain amino acid aminotransferase n=1 Tax=unclassified Kitasatospora TaxID=2633591 RepID=UPI0033CA2891